jgi:murein DD-endopeptidase MepM/ murein hydrolase activator NlpD
MEQLIPKIQEESRRTPIQTILESKNIVETWRKLNGLSNIQVELDTIDKRLEQLNRELEESKQQQEEVRAALENSLFLLKSQQDGLQLLLEQTQGEEARYQELITDLEIQRRQQVAESEQLDAQYQADLARIAAEQAAAAQQNSSNGSSTGNSGGSGNSSGGGSSAPIIRGNCRFEDGRSLGVTLSRPTTGYISDNFGCPSKTGRSHDGYDIANAQGTPIVAAYGGVVERKGFEGGGFGNYIFIRHSAGSGTFYTLYAHMIAPSPLSVGSAVGQGSQIGSMGSTGWSTGPHLHFMIISDTYAGSLGCVYGTTLCYNPGLYVNF